MITCAETLKQDLAQFTGTEQYYYNPTYPKMKYTDGVKYLATTADAYWWLDMVGTLIFPKQESGEWGRFIILQLSVEENKTNLIVSDGDENVYRTIPILYTDFPHGNWYLWLIDGVLILPSEY